MFKKVVVLSTLLIGLNCLTSSASAHTPLSNIFEMVQVNGFKDIFRPHLTPAPRSHIYTGTHTFDQVPRQESGAILS